ncbi:hypothetical protein LV89_00080 [Arcicella aurantiaca]|uniref:Uncharacterized protein n=1 Tax=Arcicella aurantiaca TaxID=591202 RepID=A0A316EF78_9BACT|nr:hypothetical protein [Arcicella aurantiaca]PWK29240.1 hypothetical protein LV89_00080 [Arcicella aurantiaca]
MKTAVIIINIIFLLILIPSAMSAIMSPMMFDAPGSDKSTKTWILFSCMVVLPILIIIAQIISWIAFFKQNYKLAMLINGIPTIDILLIGVLFFIMSSFTE